MYIEKRWYLLLAVGVSAALGAAIASKLRRRQQLNVRHAEHANAHHPDEVAHLKSWEYEGGNLAPVAATSVLP
jgi:hypothetical protein